MQANTIIAKAAKWTLFAAFIAALLPLLVIIAGDANQDVPLSRFILAKLEGLAALAILYLAFRFCIHIEVLPDYVCNFIRETENRRKTTANKEA